MVDGLVAELLAQRQEARERRDFAAADAIRDSLAALGVEVSDTAAGPRGPSPEGGLTCRGTASARARSAGRARETRPGPAVGYAAGWRARGPTPKAEDRPYHAAHKAKKAAGATRPATSSLRGPGARQRDRSGWPAAIPFFFILSQAINK